MLISEIKQEDRLILIMKHEKAIYIDIQFNLRMQLTHRTRRQELLLKKIRAKKIAGIITKTQNINHASRLRIADRAHTALHCTYFYHYHCSKDDGICHHHLFNVTVHHTPCSAIPLLAEKKRIIGFTSGTGHHYGFNSCSSWNPCADCPVIQYSYF